MLVEVTVVDTSTKLVLVEVMVVVGAVCVDVVVTVFVTVAVSVTACTVVVTTVVDFFVRVDVTAGGVMVMVGCTNRVVVDRNVSVVVLDTVGMGLTRVGPKLV